MRLVWLCWYLAVFFALLWFGASAATYHPDVQFQGNLLQAVLGLCALAMTALAMRLGRLPESHWVHEWRSWSAAVILAVAVLVVLFASVG